MKFIDKLVNSIENSNSHVCVGLDSRYDRIPDFIKKDKSISDAILEFNKQVINNTHHVTAAYKSNLAFYAGFGAEGMEGLAKTNKFIQENFPHIPTLADCKRSEMDESVTMTKKEIFEWLGFDCIMVTPWFGSDTIKDYLEDDDKGVAVYVHDSNKSAVEVQDLELVDGRKVYEEVTRLAAFDWNKNGNIFVESGATYPKQLRKVREIVGEDMVILTAGVGIQGGKIEALEGIFGKNGLRLIVNSSRGIIFAGEKDPENYFALVKKAAEDLHSVLLAESKRSV